ncbi:unnamed protein product, partial [Prorocentrum cordatum]
RGDHPDAGALPGREQLRGDVVKPWRVRAALLRLAADWKRGEAVRPVSQGRPSRVRLAALQRPGQRRAEDDRLRRAGPRLRPAPPECPVRRVLRGSALHRGVLADTPEVR